VLCAWDRVEAHAAARKYAAVAELVRRRPARGFAPAGSLLHLAGRPGEISGLGPVDPNRGANTLDRYRTGLIAECSDAFMYDRRGII
jgi:hypothetical protein